MDRKLDQDNQKLVRSGSLIVDLPSMEDGFHKMEKRDGRKIWNYIQYRESLIKWPAMNEQIRGGAL